MTGEERQGEPTAEDSIEAREGDEPPVGLVDPRKMLRDRK